MNWMQFEAWLPELLNGVKMTVLSSVISAFTAVIWGSVIASLMALQNKFLSSILRIYISIFRNSPLLVQMFFFFYGLPYVGIVLSPLACGIWAITLNEGAFIAEILRGAIRNLPVGEIEAAYSLGLSKYQVIRKIIFPLGIRSSIPMIMGQCSIVIKDTSLFSLIMILDLTRAGVRFYTRTFNNASIWIVAVIYVALFLLFSYIGKYTEKKNIVRR
jgi:His/Glu/Gln/Arg/opine family amino acid ABC transporter permease subunit